MTLKKIIVNNKKANFNYFIEQKLEAGICLLGSEVKSLRSGKVSIDEAYVKVLKGELFLCNSYVAEYDKSNRFNHDTRRMRKLLCHAKQIEKFIGKTKSDGYSIVPLSVYFNSRNIAKVEIALAKGKKLYDKRETLKQKEWDRNKERILKSKNH